MGQQTNKIQKRRRRLDYLERLKVKATAAIANKTVKKKVAPKKKAEAVAASAPAAE